MNLVNVLLIPSCQSSQCPLSSVCIETSRQAGLFSHEQSMRALVEGKYRLRSSGNKWACLATRVIGSACVHSKYMIPLPTTTILFRTPPQSWSILRLFRECHLQFISRTGIKGAEFQGAEERCPQLWPCRVGQLGLYEGMKNGIRAILHRRTGETAPFGQYPVYRGLCEDFRRRLPKDRKSL